MYAKIINQETKQCDVGTGTNTEFYKSIGMAEMDVEQAYDGSWYIQGYAPAKPECLDILEEANEIETLQTKLSETDYIDNKLFEAYIRNDGTLDELKKKYLEKLVERQQWRERIKEVETIIANKEPIYRCYNARSDSEIFYLYIAVNSTTIYCSRYNASDPVSSITDLSSSEDFKLVGITLKRIIFKYMDIQYTGYRDTTKDIR